MEYWEEVTGEDGAVYFYNHTDQEYHTSLPPYEYNNNDDDIDDDTKTAHRTEQEHDTSTPTYGDAIETPDHTTYQDHHAPLPSYNDGAEAATNHTGQDYNTQTPTHGDANPENRTDQEHHTPLPTYDDENAGTEEAPTHSGGDHESRLTLDQTVETREEGVMERWQNQMWDGIDGEVFVPWKEEDPGDMKASPDEIGLGGDLPQGETGNKLSPRERRARGGVSCSPIPALFSVFVCLPMMFQVRSIMSSTFFAKRVTLSTFHGTDRP